MSVQEVFGRATNVLLTLIILAVIAYSILLIVEPSYAPESDVILLGVSGGKLSYSVEPVLERGEGYMLVRTPSQGYTIALEPVEGGVMIYLVEERPYPLPLPAPAKAVEKGFIDVDGLRPGCVLQGVVGSGVEGPVTVKQVLALALSRSDSILINIKPEEDMKPRIEIEIPAKVGSRSFKGGSISVDLDLSRVSEVKAPQGKMVYVYLEASVEMLRGTLEFDCGGSTVELGISFANVDAKPEARFNIVDVQEQLSEDVVLPSGSYECMSTRKPVAPGKTVYTTVFDMDNLTYLYTIDVGSATIGVNAEFTGFETRVTVVSGLEEVKAVCILKSVSGDPLPILSSASLKPS
ncbi:hypothetical protein [Aeropyrum camini]|uniref:Uncharacterized protein n=1 Tax=Aeropyrum camini SY1 = JCM 12091 TaxID=1198449 RepID=U3TC02_9CREN|nr:hypothetical protein [Aeropyrum camini]BAN89956.1 hypothetical protein ACAM_0487 [Aeropyrum camini SY1 = JCM 12091]